MGKGGAGRNFRSKLINRKCVFLLMSTPARRLCTMSGAQNKIIFYDLISTHEGPYPAAIPPNTWKGRLALLHKGVEHEVKYLTFTELRAMAPKLGVERPVSEFEPVQLTRQVSIPSQENNLTQQGLV